jgi:Protein of unknown function (DUF2845)
MNTWVRSILAGAVICLGTPAQAESLRCPGGIAAEGDSKVAVIYKCGQPLLKDSFCASVVYTQTLLPVPEPIAGALIPCQLTDEWLYERGPGNLIATVRFRSGVAQSINYGRVPR